MHLRQVTKNCMQRLSGMMNRKTFLQKIITGVLLPVIFPEMIPAQCPVSPNLQVVSEIASIPTQNMLTARKDAHGRPFVYAASKEGGLKVYSVANPAQPVPVAQVAVSNWGGMHLMSLEQKGDLLYLAVGNHFNQPLQAPGLAIVSVANPASPQVLDWWAGNFSEGGAGALEVSNGVVYLGAMFNGLITLDVSNPQQIEEIGHYLPDPDFPHGVPPTHADSVKYNVRAFALRDSLLYTCFDRGGLRVLNVHNPANPVEVGRYCNENMTGFATAYNDVVLDGDYAYVSVDYLGLEVLDISDPAHIARLGWWNHWNGTPTNNPFVWAANDGHANELFLNKTCRMLFVATGKSDLFAVSVATPAQPTTCENFGGTTNGIGTYGLGADDGYIYLAYIYTVIPFASNWTGLKILSYDGCPALSQEPTFLPRGFVHLAPNPSPGSILSLLFEKPVSGEVSLFVFDLTGRQVFAQNIGKIQAGQRIETATNLPAGHYTVVVRIQGKLPEVLRWIVL